MFNFKDNIFEIFGEANNKNITFIIFGLNAMIRFHTKIANMVKKYKNYINKNSNKFRDYVALIMFNK